MAERPTKDALELAAAMLHWDLETDMTQGTAEGLAKELFMLARAIDEEIRASVHPTPPPTKLPSHGTPIQ